jgi:hypothetical protein
MLIFLAVAVPASPMPSSALDSHLQTSRSSTARSQPAHTPTFKDFDRKPATISDEEFESLRGRVMSRCRVAAGTDPAKAPWYFYYELGMELEKRGDPQRALGALIEATNHRAEPKRSARMYGMWFSNYTPYFEIAKLHFDLGNWQCAADAINISTGTREVLEGDKEFFDFQALKAAIDKQVKSN